MSTVRMVIPEKELQQLNVKLAQLGAVYQSQALQSGMRAAGRAVRDRAKELAPSTNKEFSATSVLEGILSFNVNQLLQQTMLKERGRKGGKASLKTSEAYRIKVFLRENEPVIELRVKAAQQAPHLHLVELGHDIVKGGTVPRKQSGKTPEARDPSKTGKGKVVGRVTGRPFLSRGGEYSQPKQREELNKAILKAIQKLIGG